MTTNVGGIDRILRIAIGAALLLWFFLDQGTGFWHWAKLIGVVPLYSIIGMNTCPRKG